MDYFRAEAGIRRIRDSSGDRTQWILERGVSISPFSWRRDRPGSMQHRPLARADGARLGLATVSRDLRERKRVEDGLRLPSRVGAAIVNSLEYQCTPQNIARAFVEGFAAYCVIDVMPANSPWESTVEHRGASNGHPVASSSRRFGDFFTSVAYFRGLTIVFLARTIDKVRAQLPGGVLGSSLVTSEEFQTMSAALFRRLGIDEAEFRKLVGEAGDEREVVDWVLSHTTPRGDCEMERTQRRPLHRTPRP
jgi:hypothetical protein